jgi:PAS domain S-box-containing protein
MNTKISSSNATSLAAVPQFPSHDQSGHTVQFYGEDELLLDEVSRFIGTALGSGDAAIVIATTSHREGLTRRLTARGLDVAKVAGQERYIPLDATETLSKITVDGLPDWSLFANLIGGHIERARAAATERRQSPVAIFGEIVALLWADGNTKAVLRLEQLWNELAKTHDFSLRCAYPIGSFYQEAHGESFIKICAEHSLVIPGENYTRLTGEEQRLRSIAYLQQRAQALETEMALRQSEARFRFLVEAVQDYAISMLDPEGRIVSWNTGAERIKGYRTSEIIGKHFSCFYPEEDIRSGKPQRQLEIALREGRFEDEGWRLRKDGSRFWANVIITPFKDDAGNLIGFSKVTRDFTERMLAQKALQESQRKLQDSEKSLRELSLHLLRTQDEERRRIGRELHDSLGQNLALLNISLGSLKSRARPEKIDEVRQGLAECANLAEESVKEVRTISYLLYPPMLEELGLKSAISWYLDGFTKRSGIKATLDMPPDLGRLSRDVEMAVFRVLQESLTNVHRHSGSPTATVRLLTKDGLLVLEVSDQGNGMPVSNLDEAGHDCMGALGVGLRGMTERMRQLGGTLELTSTPTGTIVIATVPIDVCSLAAAQSA